MAYSGPFPYVDGLICQATRALGSLEVEHLPRARGRSNYTFRRLVRLWLTLLLSFSVLPLRLTAILGFVVSVIGMVLLISVVAERLLYDVPVGWASVMAAILFISGVQLLMLGIVGEYVGRVVLTGSRKPQFVVRSVNGPGLADGTEE